MENPYKRKYIKGRNIDEHRYVMEQHLGRVLTFDETYTPYYAVDPIIKYLKPNTTVWCPFDKEGEYP
jgi:hypothetical protein